MTANAEPPIAFDGLDHVVLRVADLPRAIAFYTEVLGGRVERTLDELGLVQIRAGRSLIDLVGVDTPLGRAGGGPVDPKAGNLDHFALQLTRFDEEAIRAHLALHDVTVSDTGRRYGATGFAHSIYLEDPDGNTVELRAPAEPGSVLEQG